MPSTKKLDDREVIACCSFCLKPDIAVERLVAGYGVYVCNECVDLCCQIIADARESAPLPRVAPWERVDSVETALGILPNVALAQGQVGASLAGVVRRARRLGATWAQIGDALGITRQSAWERFAAEE